MKLQTRRVLHSPSAFSELIKPKWTNAPNCYAERPSHRLHVAMAKKDVLCWGEDGVRRSGTMFVFIVQNNMTCTGTVFVTCKITWYILGQFLFLSCK